MRAIARRSRARDSDALKPLVVSLLPRPPHPSRDGLAIRNHASAFGARPRVSSPGLHALRSGARVRRRVARGRRGRDRPAVPAPGPAAGRGAVEPSRRRRVLGEAVSLLLAVASARRGRRPRAALLDRRALLPPRAGGAADRRPGLGRLSQPRLGDLAADGGNRGIGARPVVCPRAGRPRPERRGNRGARRERALLRFGARRPCAARFRDPSRAARRSERRGPGPTRLSARDAAGRDGPLHRRSLLASERGRRPVAALERLAARSVAAARRAACDRRTIGARGPRPRGWSRRRVRRGGRRRARVLARSRGGGRAAPLRRRHSTEDPRSRGHRRARRFDAGRRRRARFRRRDRDPAARRPRVFRGCRRLAARRPGGGRAAGRGGARSRRGAIWMGPDRRSIRAEPWRAARATR